MSPKTLAITYQRAENYSLLPYQNKNQTFTPFHSPVTIPAGEMKGKKKVIGFFSVKSIFIVGLS